MKSGEMILIIRILILAIAFAPVGGRFIARQQNSQKIVGVYKITNIITGQYYIGQSKDIKTRLNQHFRNLDKNKHCNKKLQNGYNCYQRSRLESNNFIAEILHTCKTADEAKAIELTYLSDLTIRKNLYNLAFDPESAAKRFEGRNVLSSKIRSIISSEFRRKRIKLVINNTKYNSIAEASRHLNIPPNTIRCRLKSSNFDNYKYDDSSYSDSGVNSINNLVVKKDDYDDDGYDNDGYDNDGYNDSIYKALVDFRCRNESYVF